MYILYFLTLRAYFGILAFISIYHWKGKLFFKYRKNWLTKLQASLLPSHKKILIICPSIGEFQECRKFVRLITEHFPEHQFVYAFFSPSGYDQAKIMGKDAVRMMLPIDSKKNAIKLIDAIAPESVFVLATGIWHYYIHEIKRRNIPQYLVSFYSKKDSAFFKPILYNFYKPLFNSFNMIFCYPKEGEKLLQDHFGCTNVMTVGNLRFDCVLEMKEYTREIKGIEAFVDNRFCFVAGSTEKEEDPILAKAFHTLKQLDMKWIIVPHEKRPATLLKLKKLFGEDACFYSKDFDASKKVLIYDITGDLFQLYPHSTITMVGRGFHRYEIHNMLEPAVFYKPVLLGPMHKKFIEPKLFIKRKLAYEFNNDTELSNLIEGFYSGKLTIDKNEIQKIFDEGSGGAEKVLNYLKNN